MKRIILSGLLILGIFLCYTPSKSQNIKTIQADTLYKGFPTGTISSVDVYYNGLAVMLNHDGKLYAMNSFDSEIYREIKLDEPKPVTKYSIDDNHKYIIYNTDSDTITFIADYITGKTIQILHGKYYLSKDYIFLLYFNTAIAGSDSVGISKFAKIALSDLTPVDSFTYKFKVFDGFIPRLDGAHTIYNQNKLIIGDGGIFTSQPYHEYSTSWFIADFVGDSVIYLDISKANGFSTDYQNYLYTSKNGKYSVDIQYDMEHEDNFFVYDSTNTYQYQILGSEIKNLLNDQNLTFVRNTKIIEDKYLLFSVEQKIMNKTSRKTIVYNLDAQYPICLIDFDNYSYDYDYILAFLNKNSCIATLNLAQLTMIEPTDTDGDGRINISRVEHLQYLNDNMNELRRSKDYELDNDIDATETKNWGYGRGFNPLGLNFHPFTGGFDGQGHKIVGLYINKPKAADIAFLGQTKGNKKIENLFLENCTIIGGLYAGCLASSSSGHQIENCYASGKVNGSQAVGGLIGSFDGNGSKNSMIGCHTDVEVVGTENGIGGLVGQTSSPIINCSSNGSASGVSRVGGLLGANSSTSISNSYSTSSINGRSNIGGLIGYNKNGTITDCYAMGDVSGDSTVGGLIGYDLTGKISNSFSVGAISGKIFMGGLVGFSNEGDFKNTFWDRETSGKIKSFGGTSKSTNEMKTKSTFTEVGWDFSNVWDIDDVTNMGYPFLRQIAVSVEMEQNPKKSNALVYPNPTINKANLKVSLLENTSISIELYSLTGCKINNIYTGYLTSGEHNFDLDFSDCTNGIYSILININNEIINRWVVIQK